MAEVCPLSSLSPTQAASPRKSRQRRSAANENTTPAQKLVSAATSVRATNRFGFNKRKVPVISVTSSGYGLPALSHREAGIDLSAHVNETLGDLDAALPLLRLKTTASQYDFKAKIADLADHVKQLKHALSEQLKGGQKLKEILGSAQGELTARLQGLGDQAAQLSDEAERLRSEVKGVQQRADERGRRVQELRTSNQLLKEQEALHAENIAVQTLRSEKAEGMLAACESTLAQAQGCVEKLSAENHAHEEAQVRSAQQVRELGEQQQRELDAASKELYSVRTVAQHQENGLKLELESEVTRVKELSAQLETSSTAQKELNDSLGKLQKEQRILMDSCAGQRAKLESAETQLAEKTSLLQQKDEDLRNSIQTVTQMQRDNITQRESERQRVESLEEAARLLKLREAELSANFQASNLERGSLQTELSTTKTELREVHASLLHATKERERLAIETAERNDIIQAKQAACSDLEARLSSSQEALAAARASLEAVSEQAEALTQSKRELEVEYRSYQEHHGSSSQQQMQAISELKVIVDRLSNQVETKQLELGTQQGNLESQQQYVGTMEQKLRDAETQRRELHNIIQVRLAIDTSGGWSAPRLLSRT